MRTRKTQRALTSVTIALAALVSIYGSPAVAQQSWQLSADPNFSLDIRFSVPHPLTPIPWTDGNSYPPDMIFFDMPNIWIESAVGSHSAYLYNGTTLLGVVTNSIQGNLVNHPYLELGSFQTASSNYYGGVNRQTVIDFSSITDGSIQGRVIYTVSQGSYTYLIDSTARGILGLGTTGAFGNGDHANILSVSLIALNPNSALDQLDAEVRESKATRRLVRPMTLAKTYYAANDTQATCAVLTDFVLQAASLASGRKPKLDFAGASKLVSHAEGVMAGIGCT